TPPLVPGPPRPFSLNVVVTAEADDAIIMIAVANAIAFNAMKGPCRKNAALNQAAAYGEP
ncbi:MAG: hypothetical protein AAGI51_09480, partial [Pseudomonadota bacterium]